MGLPAIKPSETRRFGKTAWPLKATLPAALLALSGCVTPGAPSGKPKTQGTVIITPFGFFAAGKAEKKQDDGSSLDPGAQDVAAALSVAVVIAGQLQKVADECRRIGAAEYRIDCLGEGYGRVAGDIPQDETFKDARAAVAKAATDLGALAAANRAPALPEIRGGKSARPLRPVAPEKRKAVEAKAVAILAEAETVLLRSSAASPERQASYQKIAQAVNSAKVLLRS
jgi:hypothetical protein